MKSLLLIGNIVIPCFLISGIRRNRKAKDFSHSTCETWNLFDSVADERMRILKSFTLKFWEVGLFKIATVSFGVIIGASWSDFFIQWRSVLLVVCVLSSVYITAVWWKQLTAK